MARTITEFNKHLSIGTTNTLYEKIFNCRVINPTYEEGKGLYNKEFFLDKRFGMEEFVTDDFHYTDDIELYGDKYYLYHNDTEMYVGVKDGNTITTISGPFNYSSNNPIRFAEGRGANGSRKEIDLTITNGATLTTNNIIINEDGVYEDGYIVLDVGTGLNIEVGDYVLFKDNIYKGATLEIDWYDSGKIYVMGINDKGSIPINGDKIDIYSNTGKVPVIGTNDGVIAIHIDGTNICESTNILSGNIDDVVKFNEELLVLKNEVVYYSTNTFDDNLQFYQATNRKLIRGSYKLISKGKFLIVMGDDNRLVSPFVDTNNISGGYTFYPLNYNSDLYSRYSYIFVDSSLYILQSNKRLAKINISSLNATAFNLEPEYITETVRGLFSDIEDYNSTDKGEIYVNINNNDSRLHFLYIKNEGGTIEYEYDTHYKHWLLNTYAKDVYKITDQFLLNGHVADIGGYTDLGEEYKQSINFTIQIHNLITKVGLIRNVMGISNDFPLKYNIDIDVESSLSTTHRTLEVKNMTFDTMPIDHSLDMLNILNNGKDNKHNGNIASVQRTIMMSGRYHRYDINGYDRFIYGYSYVLGVPSNIFVNERNFSF